MGVHALGVQVEMHRLVPCFAAPLTQISAEQPTCPIAEPLAPQAEQQNNHQPACVYLKFILTRCVYLVSYVYPDPRMPRAKTQHLLPRRPR